MSRQSPYTVILLVPIAAWNRNLKPDQPQIRPRTASVREEFPRGVYLEFRHMPKHPFRTNGDVPISSTNSKRIRLNPRAFAAVLLAAALAFTAVYPVAE